MEGLGVLREQTKRYINERPVALVLKRHTRSDDGAGGYTETSGDLSPQTVRINNMFRVNTNVRRNVDGQMVMPDLMIITEYNANIMPGDTFTYNGLNMQVVWVSDLEYEKQAEVVAR